MTPISNSAVLTSSKPIDWQIELSLIMTAATMRNLDHQWLRTIRQVENGGSGREFGVLSIGASTYQEQLDECASTVAHRLESYPANPLQRCYSAKGYGRIRYTPSWISYFSSIWCPIGATNDPTHLNKNWLQNALTVYANFIQEEFN